MVRRALAGEHLRKLSARRRERTAFCQPACGSSLQCLEDNEKGSESHAKVHQKIRNSVRRSREGDSRNVRVRAAGNKRRIYERDFSSSGERLPTRISETQTDSSDRQTEDLPIGYLLVARRSPRVLQ